MAYAMKQAKAGTEVFEIIRKMGVSEQTFYRRKRRYAGMPHLPRSSIVAVVLHRAEIGITDE